MKCFCFKQNKIDIEPVYFNTVYHGTLQNFAPEKINSPSWFSLEEDQSVKWIYYKYTKNNLSGNKIGYLHKFSVISLPNLLDINTNSNLRLEINANGNYHFSQRIKNGEYGNYDGYINMEDQAEIMLCDPSKFLQIQETIKIQIEKFSNINYEKTSKGWRL
tara:strand:- start:245 stop:727 length:483 start_codon:yes stop_codon:yes gene_type:complete